MFRLILTIDGHIIGDYTLQDGDVLTFGRSADNDIVISDEVVSFYQAYIVRLGDDAVLWDRGDGNGTIVNGAKVDSAYLRNGDIITIGDHYILKTSIEDGQKQG